MISQRVMDQFNYRQVEFLGPYLTSEALNHWPYSHLDLSLNDNMNEFFPFSLAEVEFTTPALT